MNDLLNNFDLIIQFYFANINKFFTMYIFFDSIKRDLSKKFFNTFSKKLYW